MAKSTRSKVKRSFRSKKRETGVYAATEAARLHRLNQRLVQIAKQDKDGDALVEDAVNEDVDTPDTGSTPLQTQIEADGTQENLKRISTHGLRGSRREEWRKSKGLKPRPASAGVNRQGGIAAKRRAGRSKRRR